MKEFALVLWYFIWYCTAKIAPLLIVLCGDVGAVVLKSYLHVDGVVVACEGIESSQLCPADTEFLLRLIAEATDICSHQRDAQKVESQDA